MNHRLVMHHDHRADRDRQLDSHDQPEFEPERSLPGLVPIDFLGGEGAWAAAKQAEHQQRGLRRAPQTKLGATNIVVTHDMVSAYKIADRIAMLLDGRIIFVGTPEETRATSNPYVRQFINGQRKLGAEAD